MQLIVPLFIELQGQLQASAVAMDCSVCLPM